MKIERFEIPGLAQYSYIVSADGQAAVVDPIRDIDRYTTYAAQQSLTITHVLETHIHADFASGAAALADATGAQLALSGHDSGQHYQYAMPHCALRDGDTIALGGIRIQALYTPGHTPEHLSFLVFDTASNSLHAAALLSGDFLFAGSLGRPDLLGDEAKYCLARELYRSLHERIAFLPDDVRLYPGHGAGSFCGAGMREQADSTLGQERATNPFFHLAEEEFIAEILASVPPMPAYYPRMKSLNAKGAPSLVSLPGGRTLTYAKACDLSRQKDVTLLDLRSAEAFAAGHIPRSINIGAGPSLSLWAGWLLDPEQRIVLIGEDGEEEQARRSLVRVGLDCIEGHFPDAIAAWRDAGGELAHIAQLSPEQVQMRCHGERVIDVRSAKEWARGHIGCAKNVPLGDLLGKLDCLSANRPIALVCEGGYRSSIAASLLAHHGLYGINTMAGGMAAWNRQKLPITND
ncbi:MAG: MBL fold metallo-hydrolase [Acidobacteriaceae bacterium]